MCVEGELGEHDGINPGCMQRIIQCKVQICLQKKHTNYTKTLFEEATGKVS